MVSNIGDDWGQKFPKKWPGIIPHLPPPDEPYHPPPQVVIQQGVSQAAFDALKKEVEELKKLLEAAKAYDAATGQPHCEMDEKVRLIKAVAKLVGVDLGNVFEAAKKKVKRKAKAK